jgi:hypothetical protein
MTNRVGERDTGDWDRDREQSKGLLNMQRQEDTFISNRSNDAHDGSRDAKVPGYGGGLTKLQFSPSGYMQSSPLSRL